MPCLRLPRTAPDRDAAPASGVTHFKDSGESAACPRAEAYVDCMTPADERVLALLQKWQKSLDLHARYADLPEDQYWLVQPWPNHQRPTKWVIDLARQRLADLQKIVQTRLATGDQSLSEGLELMSFLTNLVGSQHVERFVPIAEPERERQLDAAPAPAKRKATGSTSTSTAIANLLRQYRATRQQGVASHADRQCRELDTSRESFTDVTVAVTVGRQDAAVQGGAMASARSSIRSPTTLVVEDTVAHLMAFPLQA